MNESKRLISKYIAEKEPSIDNRYRCLYHMGPRVGWMNDPNGLIYFQNQYHLYYQANPYRTKPGQMVWGHFVSKDLVSYEDVGVALSFDPLGENAYSGGAIEEGDAIHIFYTLHTEKHPHIVRYDGDLLEGEEIYTEDDNERRKTAYRPSEGKDVKEEDVYHSFSPDGMDFEKGERVFDNETLPANLSRTDFRDPCPVKVGGSYYLFVGGKDIEKNQGVIIVLKGKTLDHFDYAFHLGPYYELGDMAECPCYRKVDGKDVILVSGCNVVRRINDFRNINSSLFLVGDLDFEKGEMKVDFIKEIDKGDSFYAPQFIQGAEKPIMVGWMEMWGKKYPTSRLHHGYVGAFSFPRELSYHDGDLYQTPVDALASYQKPWDGTVLPRQCEITFNLKKNGYILIEGENGDLRLGSSDVGVYLDNTRANSLYDCIRHTNGKYFYCSVKILLDTSSIEVFINSGKEAITSRYYIDGPLHLSAVGEVHEILVKEIGGNK